MTTRDGETPEPASNVSFEGSPEIIKALHRPLSSGKRWAQVALSALVVVLAVVFVVRPGLLPGFGFLNAAHSTPIISHIAIHSTVNYGTLTVNGNAQNFTPSMIIGLHAGKNTLTLTAPPFQRVSCVISQPQQAGDTCQIVAGISTGLTGILLPVTLHDLPQVLHQSALQTIQDSFNAIAAQLHASVQPGEWYPTQINSNNKLPAYTIEQTHQTLTATVALNTQSPDDCDLANPASNCAPFDILFGDTLLPAWGMLMPLSAFWRFTDVSGHVIAQLTAPPQLDSIPLLLHHDPARGWQFIVDRGIVEGANIASNDTLVQAIEAEMCTTSLSAFQEKNQAQLISTITLGSISMQGCVSNYVANPPRNMQGNGVIANVLIRFGVVLAADSYTYQFYQRFPPLMPLATLQELAAAQAAG